MKTISGLATMLLSVILAATSWAVTFDYTGTTTIDLTTLRFSGILATYTPGFQFSQSIVETRDGATTQRPLAINHGPIVEQNVSASLKGVGSASAFNDATRMTATVHFTGPLGFVSSDVVQQGTLVASQPGALSVTVQYTMSHSGVPTDLAQAAAWAGPTLIVGNSFDSAQRWSSTSDSTESGLLSVTRFFTLGESVGFSVGAYNKALSVPVPDMLWPTAIGMIGLAGFVAWRQRGGRLS